MSPNSFLEDEAWAAGFVLPSRNILSSFMDQTEKLLLGPGPCNISLRVRESLSRPMVGHLDPTFLETMESCKERLRQVMGTSNPVTFPLSGTGSAGMEFLLVNFLEPGDTIVVGVNGVFGTRMANLATKMGAQVVRVEAPWGEAIAQETLLDAIAQHRPKLCGVVNGETSTGVYQRVDQLAEALHEYGGLLAVDCVTSLSGMPVELDAWGVDLAFSATQKCLACPPGLSPVTVSSRALEVHAARTKPAPTFYFDLKEILAYVDGTGGRSYHHTAPISMVTALNEALAEVLAEGLARRIQRHADTAHYLLENLAPRGFRPLVAEANRLNPLTTLLLPEDFDEASARRCLLLEHNIEVGGGLGPLAGKIWRIGLMGHNAQPAIVDRFLDALSQVTTKS